MKVYHNFIFPSLLTEIECAGFDEIKNEIIDEIYQYQSSVESVHYSNYGGWQSPHYFYDLVSSSDQISLFEKFKSYILKYIKYANPYQYDLQISNAWININRKGNFNQTHCHPSSVLSGVFWVKTPQNGGNITFINPNMFSEGLLAESIHSDMAKEHNFYNTFEFLPHPGNLILFPSHIFHNVTPNESDEDRISIAFNLNIYVER